VYTAFTLRCDTNLLSEYAERRKFYTEYVAFGKVFGIRWNTYVFHLPPLTHSQVHTYTRTLVQSYCRTRMQVLLKFCAQEPAAPVPILCRAPSRGASDATTRGTSLRCAPHTRARLAYSLIAYTQSARAFRACPAEYPFQSCFGIRGIRTILELFWNTWNTYSDSRHPGLSPGPINRRLRRRAQELVFTHSKCGRKRVNSQ